MNPKNANPKKKHEEVEVDDNLISVTPSKIDPPAPAIRPGDEINVSGQPKVVERTTEASVTFKTPPPPKENLLSVRAVEQFSDGNLAEFFSKFGYPCDWPRDEVRKIPYWLVQRVQNSGGEVELMR